MATDNQGTGSTEEQKAFLRALTDAKPRWLEDGLGIRGAARQEFAQQMRSEWPDPTVTVKTGERPPVTQPTALVRPPQPTPSDDFFPFKVSSGKDNSDPPLPIWKFYPGTVSTVVPTATGIPLTDEDAGIYPPGDPPYDILLRCEIDKENPDENAFRSSIQTAEIVTDLGEASGDKDGDEVPELKMHWDDDDTQIKGYFYIRIASIKAVTNPETGLVTPRIIQWLFNNYRTFVLTDSDVIPVI